MNPGEVINHENGLLSGTVPLYNPSQEFCLIHDYLMAQNWPKCWAISDVVRSILQNSSDKQLRQNYNDFALKTKSLLDSTREDVKYIEKTKARSRLTRTMGKKYDTATRELLQLGLYFVFQNKEMQMPAKEWHDFFHTIVPVAYCDFVLLDKRWKGFISQTGLRFPDIATIFDKNSIPLFMKELETRE